MSSLTPDTQPVVKRLDSGYWHVRWSRQAWAQWPVGRSVTREDFFQPGWSYSEARAAEANRLTESITERSDGDGR